MWVTAADLARLTVLSRQRINQLRTEFRNQWEHGKGPALRIYAPSWLQMWLASREQNREPGGRDEYTGRLKKAQAEKAELDLAEARGELLSVDEVKRDVAALCGGVREGIESCCRTCQDVMRSKVIEAAHNLGVEMTNGHSNGKAKTTKRQAAAPRPPRRK